MKIRTSGLPTCSLLLFLSLLLASCDPPPSAYDELGEALKLYMEGDNEKAIHRLRLIRRDYPRLRESNLLYGRVLFYSGRYAEAASVLEEALHPVPNLDSVKILARSYLRMDEVNMAEKLLAESLKISSEDPELLYLAALCRIAFNDPAKALSLLTAACTVMERQIEIPLELAALYSRYGLYSEAAALIGRYKNILDEEDPLKRAMEGLNRELEKKKGPSKN